MPAIPVVAAYAALETSMVSTVIGAAVVGAVAGGVVAAVQGENILKGALMGGISGAVVGFAEGAEIGMGIGDDAVSTAAGTAPSELGAAGQLANAEANAGLLPASEVAESGSVGAAQQMANANLVSGVDEAGGMITPAQATANAQSANIIAGDAAKASATKLAANNIVADTVKKGASQNPGKFLAGLDSGEKMMIVSGLAQGAGDAYSSYATNQAQEDLYNQQNEQRQVTGSLLPSDGQIRVNNPPTSANPNLTARAKSIAQNQGLLKPTIQRPTIYKPGVTYA